MSMVAAAAATSRCPGRFWGHPEGVPKEVTPTPPQHFTFEPLPPPRDPRKPRRRHRRVLYPPAVRRPLPSEEPSAAKRLLLLLLAVVGTQIYHAPCDVTDAPPGAPLGARAPLGAAPIPEEPRIPGGNATELAAPVGGACPPLWVAPPGGARTL